MEMRIPDVIVESFALGPAGDFIEVSFSQPNLDPDSGIDELISWRIPLNEVEAEVAELQEVLVAIVEKMFVKKRRPAPTVPSRSRRG
jgi:hypothetical protein